LPTAYKIIADLEGPQILEETTGGSREKKLGMGSIQIYMVNFYKRSLLPGLGFISML